MQCFQCKKILPSPPYGKVSFRAACDHCGADLHSCKNCKYYKPGLPNDCAVPGTEFVSDRARNNLCEEFRLQDQAAKASQPRPNASKNFFDDLFK